MSLLTPSQSAAPRMSNPSKAIGTRAETKVKRYFNDHGLRCERKALAGSDDEGDLRLYLPDGLEVAVEVKAGKQTANYNRTLLSEWKRQTLTESINSGCQAMLIIVRYRRAFDDAEIWIPTVINRDEDVRRLAWRMTYIDDFVSTILEE